MHKQSSPASWRVNSQTSVVLQANSVHFVSCQLILTRDKCDSYSLHDAKGNYMGSIFLYDYDLSVPEYHNTIRVEQKK